jgi:hypothetical protein
MGSNAAAVESSVSPTFSPVDQIRKHYGVYLANHDARAGLNSFGIPALGPRAQIGPDKRLNTRQSV